MMTKRTLRAWPAIACMALVLAAGVVRADEIPLVTGRHWTESTEPMKKAYLVGIANLAQVDVAFQAGNAPSDAQSVIPRLARGLRGQSLDSVRQALDGWYAAHPDRLQRPVLETIWFELVVPGLAKSN